MKKKKELIFIIIIFITLIYIINNPNILNKYILYSSKLFFYKVFPFLFTMIIINELLINNNILFYITKIFKRQGIKYYVIFMSMLSGSPTNIYLIKELYLNNIISNKNANKLLICTHFANPIFLINMLNHLFNKKETIIILLLHYLPNIIISIFIKINYQNNYINKNTSFKTIINKATSTCLLVLGTLTFYIVLSNIFLNILNINNYYKVLIKGIIEMTQGLNEIDTLLISTKRQVSLALLFLNFGGISIHSQIKSIISDTPLDYKYFLIGRLIISIIYLLV